RRPAAAGRGAVHRSGSSDGLELGQAHVLDLAERKLEETLPKGPEELRVAGGEEAVAALTPCVVLEPLAGERLGDLARRLLRGEDERHVAAERSLEDRAQKWIVRAPEDDRVAAGVLERRGVLAHRPDDL